MTTAVDIELAEWQQAEPSTYPALTGLKLSDSGPDRRLAEELAQQGALRVVELASGLGFETRAYVGSVQLGQLRVRVRPKIAGEALLALLRYAYGFRRLKIYEEHPGVIDEFGLHDLLILQMKAEAAELIARGVHREYRRRDAVLSNPMGRIDFLSLARTPSTSAGLPCRFHRRLEDCLQNRALLAGLHFAAQLTSDPKLRSNLLRLAQLLEDEVTLEPVSTDMFRKLRIEDNRLVAAYRPFLHLLQLLFSGYSATVTKGDERAELPGFMLDMNLFFQDLIGRYLTDYADGYVVQEQWRLKDIFSYQPGHNPKGRPTPQPRPDFVVMRGGEVLALLDAKYRDLWATELPRDILYQLTIYALAQRAPRTAVILYPTTDPAAEEARIAIHEPLDGAEQGTVVLRPVNLDRLAKMLGTPDTASTYQERRDFAQELAFGDVWAGVPSKTSRIATI